MGGEKGVGGDKKKRGRIEQRGNTSGFKLSSYFALICVLVTCSASWKDGLELSDKKATVDVIQIKLT